MSPAAVDPDQARETAREILGRREFGEERTPRPLRGALEWIGDRVDDLLRPIGDFFSWLFDLFPGIAGTLFGIAVVVAAAALVAWLVTRQLARHRAASASIGGTDPDSRADDPDALERDAVTAERAGDYSTAVRLRYRAGLLRLDRSHAIRLRASSTSTAVGRMLQSARFDRLATTFDTVTYGERLASEQQASDAAAEWPVLLSEVRHR